MASIGQDFELWDGNDDIEIFDVTGNVEGGTASWKASDRLDTDGSPYTVTKVPSVGAYVSATGTTPVTLTIDAADFNGYPGTYDHELTVTLGGKVRTVAVGTLTVHSSLVT